MTTKTAKLRPPVKRHGGKAYLATKIIPLLRSHRTYVEPFIGGGSVLLNKLKAEREIAGDLDSDLINFWRKLKCRSVGFCESLAGIDYGPEWFADARHMLEVEPEKYSDLELATAFIIRNRFSRGGFGKTFAESTRLRGGQNEQVNSWQTIRAALPAIAARVGDVEFHCRPALELIHDYGGDRDTLIYADPPYAHETRTAKKAYGEFEMDRGDHVSLLSALANCRASVVLSGYRCDFYDSMLSGWERRDFDLPNHSGQGKTKQRRIESVWIKEAAR